MTASIQSIVQKAVQFKKIDPSKLNRKQQKVVKDICRCRTEEAGFHVDTCDSCGHETIHYNSCKNPCCPKCQAVNKEVWSMKQEFYVLDIPYFHVVFTLPDVLNKLALIDPVLVYELLFESASETLKQLSEDPQYLGAKIGFTAVLHTWGSNLTLHPHLHCVVSGGGIDAYGKWKSSKKKFFIPVKVMSALFKGKYLSKLKKRFDKTKLYEPSEFQQIINKCYEKDWVVYTKKPMSNPSTVIKYLARYTHRIAISNSRIVSNENGKVVFKYKDYKDNAKVKEMTLTEDEFCRRYLMHVPPHKFMRIRHYGFLGNRNKNDRIILLRKLTKTPDHDPFKVDMVKVISRLLKKDVSICPCCGNLRHPLLE
jgi:hypothetical protein